MKKGFFKNLNQNLLSLCDSLISLTLLRCCPATEINQFKKNIGQHLRRVREIKESQRESKFRTNYLPFFLWNQFLLQSGIHITYDIYVSATDTQTAGKETK